MTQHEAKPCRSPWCDNRRTPDGRYRQFCSDKCGVKFEHIRQDAREARLDDQRATNGTARHD